ncbi:hypothetical protein PRZ48_013732 [Zasmidium cellare]|uniref:Heterokaryon incompatibility domain-containing protein n=1 Tax=Zasmidium cellare TaxID=395010 RepID=A0ABR0E2G9_ZASCE|nr:hypothetical protein PRZ48_013732 [Zasmidium cellare]
MRLIDTHTGELKEYTGSQIPPYVALSHRWTDDEITFKDYIKHRRTESLGHKKVNIFRDVARSNGHRHVWIDTACIDKRSSSELSEAINSMFSWYGNAVECYAYLSDVHDANDETFQQLRSSVWFTRGWTLQELVAPKTVRYYTSNWVGMGYSGHGSVSQDVFSTLGRLCDRNLSSPISDITSIPIEVLWNSTFVPSRSTAERMSWLRGRTTTRDEDMAYCALGLFGINMPLLYGEGSRAWNRLQEEVIRTSNDETIFAWSTKVNSSRPYSTVPILAFSPDLFLNNNETAYRMGINYFPRLPYAITNQGLELRLKAGTAYKTTIPMKSAVTGASENHTLLTIPLNSWFQQPALGPMSDFVVLLLLSQYCGHYDRVLTPVTLDEPADDSPDLLQSDETVYVHTTTEMQNRCYHHSMMPGEGGVVYRYTTYFDVDVEEIVQRARANGQSKRPALEVGSGTDAPSLE